MLILLVYYTFILLSYGYLIQAKVLLLLVVIQRLLLQEVSFAWMVTLKCLELVQTDHSEQQRDLVLV